MLFSRWTPLSSRGMWDQIHDLQGEMNRLFDTWGDRGRQFLGLAGFPPLCVWEEEDAVCLEAEMPGLEMKDLEIFVTGHNQLTIKGERKPPVIDKAMQHRQERNYGVFARTVTLPVPVDENKVEARLEFGMLSLRMPKHEIAKPRKIAIKAS